LEIKPIHGQHWARKQHPDRLRATYRRLAGTEQFLGYYDVHSDCLAGTIRKRKTIRDVRIAFERLRRSYPKRKKICVIMDNLPLHKSDKLVRFYAKNNIVPVWTPTYSSWLNLIESHFGAMKKATLNNTDDPDHQTRRRRIYRYVRWRNKRVGSNKFKLNELFNH
jgi:transposase